MSADTANLAAAITYALFSMSEDDANGKQANVVDGLFAIARAIDSLAVAVADPEQWRHAH